MGCQQGREKSNSQRNSAEKQQTENPDNMQNSFQTSNILENLENIRNNEDLTKIIVKRLIVNNQLHLSTKLRKKSEDLCDQGKFQEAMEIQKKVLDLQRESNANQENQYEYSKTLVRIGNICAKLELFEKAFDYYREILDLSNFPESKKVHIDGLNLINEISETLLQKGKLELALLYKKEVLNFTTFFFGEESKENFAPDVEKLREEISQYQEIYKGVLELQTNHEFIDPSYFLSENECMICCKEFETSPSQIKKVKRKSSQLDLDCTDITKLRCKHVFHSHCINQWFLKQQNCPYCRSDLVIDEQDEIEENINNNNNEAEQIEGFDEDYQFGQLNTESNNSSAFAGSL